jgi:hypothetical protein
MNDRKEPDMKLINIAGCASGTCPAIYRVVAGGCNHGGCPTVYEGDNGTLVVQGATVDPADAGIDVPAGEQLVEIPAALLRDEAFGSDQTLDLFAKLTALAAWWDTYPDRQVCAGDLRAVLDDRYDPRPGPEDAR